MRFERLLQTVADEPVFTSAMLLSGVSSPAQVRRQLSRWVKGGKVHMLRRGVYALAPPYSRVEPHPFLVANALKRASYVSLESALSHYGLIPEHVPVTTSVTTGRPEELDTPLGRYVFRHVRRSLFFGYDETEISAGRPALLAMPEKALLDLLYLTPGAGDPDYLRELRLDVSNIRWDDLDDMARRCRSRKLGLAVARLRRIGEDESEVREL